MNQMEDAGSQTHDSSPRNELRLPSNLRYKIEFGPLIPLIEQGGILVDIVKQGESNMRLKLFQRANGWNDHHVTLDEGACIQTMINRARAVLVDIGIDNASELLPTMEQLAFSEKQNAQLAASTEEFGCNIHFQLPKGMSVADKNFQFTFYHELAHFVTRILVEKAQTKRGYAVISTGYDTEPISNDDTPKGVFEEGTADLFALHCLNDPEAEIILDSDIDSQVVLSLAFIHKLASLTNKPDADILKVLFKGKAQRDFSFLRNVAETFNSVGINGEEIVYDLNNIRPITGTASNFMKKLAEFAKRIKESDPETVQKQMEAEIKAGRQRYRKYLEEIARKGDFDEGFRELEDKFENGEGVDLAGVPGKLKRKLK